MMFIDTLVLRREELISKSDSCDLKFSCFMCPVITWSNISSHLGSGVTNTSLEAQPSVCS